LNKIIFKGGDIMEKAKKIKLEEFDKSLNELLTEFDPTIEEHVKSVNDQVAEVLMGRCPPQPTDG